MKVERKSVPGGWTGVEEEAKKPCSPNLVLVLTQVVDECNASD